MRQHRTNLTGYYSIVIGGGTIMSSVSLSRLSQETLTSLEGYRSAHTALLQAAYGRKDVVHFQFYVADSEEGKDGVGENEDRRQRGLEKVKMQESNHQRRGLNEGPAAKRQHSTPGPAAVANHDRMVDYFKLSVINNSLRN
eukprot:g30925.t1